METAKIAKQMIGFQKTFFENTFNAMVIVQDQAENIFNGFLNQFPWVTTDGKKTWNDTMQFTKKTRDDFKKTVDDGYSRMEELYEIK
jgi:hypothetical protein